MKSKLLLRVHGCGLEQKGPLFWELPLPFLDFHSGNLLCKSSSNGNVTHRCFAPNRETGICLFKADGGSVHRSGLPLHLSPPPSSGHAPSPNTLFLWIKKHSVAIVTFPGGACHALGFSFCHLCHIFSCDGCAHLHSFSALVGLRKQHTAGFLSLPILYYSRCPRCHLCHARVSRV